MLFVLGVQISGKFSVDGSGNVNFQEQDGIDYAPVTVQLPGGERVPFLFTIKELNAKGSLGGFGGDFVVPSYRGSSFLDPKVCANCKQMCHGHCGILPASREGDRGHLRCKALCLCV